MTRSIDLRAPSRLGADRSAPDAGAADRAVRDLAEAWQRGEPSLEQCWFDHGGSLTVWSTPTLTSNGRQTVTCGG